MIRSQSGLWKDLERKLGSVSAFRYMRNTLCWFCWKNLSTLSWFLFGDIFIVQVWCENNEVSQKGVISMPDDEQNALCLCFCVWIKWEGETIPSWLVSVLECKVSRLLKNLHRVTALVIYWVSRGLWSFWRDFTSPSYPECNAASQTLGLTLPQKEVCLCKHHLAHWSLEM